MSDNFNPHGNKTADGVLITVGMRVFDNSLDIGTVVKDNTSPDNCCGTESGHFGQIRIGSGWYSDHNAATCDRSKYCRHDHWFDILMDSGVTRQMNGERMAVQFAGRHA